MPSTTGALVDGLAQHCPKETWIKRNKDKYGTSTCFDQITALKGETRVRLCVSLKYKNATIDGGKSAAVSEVSRIQVPGRASIPSPRSPVTISKETRYTRSGGDSD